VSDGPRTPDPGPRQFRLLVADIDGTLVTSNREITPGVLGAVRKAQQRGVRVCLATGRIWPSAEPYFRRLGADPPAILYNGGLVYDFHTDTVLRRVPLAVDHARAALEILRAIPEVQPHLYVGDRVYTARTSEATDRYKRKDNLPVEEVGDLLAFLPPDPRTIRTARVQGEPRTTHAAGVQGEPMKILIIGARSDLERVVGRIRALPLPINWVFSDETFLEILPEGSSKGAALEFVARRLTIPMEQVIAVGDNLNDFEMIRAAGLGVAMGNAPAELRSQADYVTATNDEEGLREVIERFILK
jgi:Cof subfamily protein (haloacid dehalogenase superfamily)